MSVQGLRAIVLLLFLGLCGCMKSKQPEPDPSAVPYPLRGQVVRLTPGDHIATIRHERVEGWMEAMTMDFLVTDESGFAALHAGDRVSATVMVGKTSFWIREIHREF